MGQVKSKAGPVSACGVIVIPRLGLPPIRDEFMNSFFHGLFCFVASFAFPIIIVAGTNDLSFVAIALVLVMVIVSITWPIIRLRRNAGRIVTARRVAVLGIPFGIGLLGFAMAGVFIPIAMNPFVLSNWAPAGVMLLLFLAVDVLCVVAWQLVRLSLPPFVVQDGTLCPGCGYCLVGATNMRCPECGRVFNYDELETTEAEFRYRTLTADL